MRFRLRTAVLVTLIFGGTTVQAQTIFITPPTTPLYRPQFGPQYGLFGSPFGSPYGVGPYGSAPGGYYSQQNPQYGAAQTANLIQQVNQGIAANQSATDISDSTITGHPTRFLSYQQYFMNQGVRAANSVPAGQAPGAATAITRFGVNGLSQTQAGARPPRGQANTPPRPGR